MCDEKHSLGFKTELNHKLVIKSLVKEWKNLTLHLHFLALCTALTTQCASTLKLCSGWLKASKEILGPTQCCQLQILKSKKFMNRPEPTSSLGKILI